MKRWIPEKNYICAQCWRLVHRPMPLKTKLCPEASKWSVAIAKFFKILPNCYNLLIYERWFCPIMIRWERSRFSTFNFFTLHRGIVTANSRRRSFQWNYKLSTGLSAEETINQGRKAQSFSHQCSSLNLSPRKQAQIKFYIWAIMIICWEKD